MLWLLVQTFAPVPTFMSIDERKARRRGDKIAAKGNYRPPAARQQHEAFFGFGQFDHFQSDARRSGGFGRRVGRVALVYIANVTLRSVASWTCAMSSATCARSCSSAGVT